MPNTKLRTQHSYGHSHILGVLATLIFIMAALLLLINRQYVVDQLSVWQYQPSSAITQLIDRAGMNDTGKFYFYASHPAIENAQTFNSDCNRKETSTAILGCYDGRYIYLYNVTDTRLDGVEEVTAAHETLHAIYSRLSDAEKQSVDTLLEAEYNKLKTDKNFASRMAFYAQTEPGERDNELHSIIGTEIASISPQLETYYSKYFSDRSKVVALNDKYSSVFTQLQTEGDSLSSQLTQLGNTIQTQTQAYNSAVGTLNADIEAFNQKASSSGGFATQQEFNSERSVLLSRSNQLDAQRVTINNEITQYNSIRQQLINVSSQSRALDQSINSSLAPAPSL
jgi:hypothetical protein